MQRMVAPYYADGFLCPACGRPLRWLGVWRGAEFLRKHKDVLLTERACHSDVPEQVVVSRSGLEAKTETRFRHRCELECVPCCRIYALDQARRGTLEDRLYPGDYFLGGSQASLPTVIARRVASANGVQTAGPARDGA